jgi:hypothetical protein
VAGSLVRSLGESAPAHSAAPLQGVCHAVYASPQNKCKIVLKFLGTTPISYMKARYGMKRIWIKWFGLHGKAHLAKEQREIDALLGMGL